MPYREDARPAEAIREHLLAEEELLWSGKPPQGPQFRAIDLFVVPFSVAWAGFAVFWTVTAASGGAPFLFWGVGLLFIAIGVYMVAGRFWVDARTRARTLYGVTDQRVLIVGGVFGVNVTSLPLVTLPQIVTKSKANGGGQIEFGNSGPFGGVRIAGWPGASRSEPPCFELPDGVTDVQQLILQARKEAQRAE